MGARAAGHGPGGPHGGRRHIPAPPGARSYGCTSYAPGAEVLPARQRPEETPKGYRLAAAGSGALKTNDGAVEGSHGRRFGTFNKEGREVDRSACRIARPLVG